MPILVSFLLASQALGIARGAAATGPRAAPRTENECVSLQVGLPAGARVPARRPVFSAGEVAEMEITARGRHSLAGRNLELRLFLPDGHLYQKIGVRDPAASSTSARHRRRSSTASRVATARLPLAGTAITLSSLYGTWSVVPYEDERPVPCRPSLFVIRP